MGPFSALNRSQTGKGFGKIDLASDDTSLNLLQGRVKKKKKLTISSL